MSGRDEELLAMAAIRLVTGAQAAVAYAKAGFTRTDLGLWLDTSDQTPEETVDEIIERAAEASVG